MQFNSNTESCTNLFNSYVHNHSHPKCLTQADFMLKVLKSILDFIIIANKIIFHQFKYKRNDVLLENDLRLRSVVETCWVCSFLSTF